MKLSTVLIAACATVALVASSATAATVKTLPHHIVDKHIVTVKHVTPSTVRTRTETPHVVYTAPFGASPITTPIYIYIPAGNPALTVPLAPVDCSQSPDACTPADLCNIWGEC